MNKFKKILYHITRPYAKKYLTNHLGKVVEDDEKITCYVKRSRIKKKSYSYNIACFGIGENQKRIAKAYKLDKPICYVIDGLKLKKHRAYIFGYSNCEVIIKNCNFGLGLNIDVNGKCTLDNTNIIDIDSFSIYAYELVIKNMNSEQIKVIGCSESKIRCIAEYKIDVIDSNIGSQKKKNNVSFSVENELNIVDSNIVGKEVKCESNVINTDEKSSLIATDKVILQTDNFNPINININAPTIILNGEEIENETKPVNFKKITEPLALKRLELVNLLRKVRSECENINSEKILKYQEELNVKPVSKVLKKIDELN